MRRSWPALGCSATKNSDKKNDKTITENHVEIETNSSRHTKSRFEVIKTLLLKI
jgi:hypothetical protein